jgi:Asp-tRNA(Asn)/Glu-tRNA(Gln) amidotransferase C subunit
MVAGENEMEGKKELKREAFLSVAKGFGLDINDPHIEELYTYVQKILPTLRRIEELDLTDMEPTMPPSFQRHKSNPSGTS